jgi:hypothetical protein
VVDMLCRCAWLGKVRVRREKKIFFELYSRSSTRCYIFTRHTLPLYEISERGGLFTHHFVKRLEGTSRRMGVAMSYSLPMLHFHCVDET